jgi:hypothetical protein
MITGKLSETPDEWLWFGVYRGINWEISAHKRSEGMLRYCPDPVVWCFYLKLQVESFPTEVQESMWVPVSFTSYGSQMEILPYEHFLYDLKWHGGLTYYSKCTPSDYVFRGIKVGCDYQHLWDENKHYDINIVYGEVKDCIDSLWDAFPNLKTNDQLWEEHRKPYHEKMKAK